MTYVLIFVNGNADQRTRIVWFLLSSDILACLKQDISSYTVQNIFGVEIPHPNRVVRKVEYLPCTEQPAGEFIQTNIPFRARFTPDTVWGMTTGKSTFHLNSVSELSVTTTCQNTKYNTMMCVACCLLQYRTLHTNTLHSYTTTTTIHSTHDNDWQPSVVP